MDPLPLDTPAPAAAEPAAPEPTLDDAIAAAEAASGDARRWVRAIVPIIETYSREPERSEAVQGALDALVVTACARLKRLLR